MYCIPGYFLVEESSPTSAGNLEWFIRNLMNHEKNDAQTEGRSIYELADKWIEEDDFQYDSPIFLPFLNGSNEDPLAKGSFIGLSAFHTKKHMLRAVYEGVVFSHLTHVNKLLQSRKQPESILLSGGASKSDVWTQIFADVLQIPIEVVEDKELGAHGAAIAAGISVGIYPDYATAIKTAVKISKTVLPRQERKVFYENRYSYYRTVVEALNGSWSQLAGKGSAK